ncbi:hypothetical protein O0I10_012976 [Lichtheimia ornata]|uniref:Uncharacterized protein n=1 Tax=Lichtheimia ornata TaxID=688661 RepID=A0AAD7UQC4_9FUNG|nr:uncharacterized protein O0I10_012976 [Lichtheimia ornata]KAJ8651468.1 hypothetical protein O0I10_012976 [Lichtheimia ornata]
MGEQVVNGDTFNYNKHVRDLPMTQASIPIQHVGVVSSIQDPVNMLDDGTSGSNRIRISKQECCMVGSMSAGDDCVIQRDHCRELLVF